MMFSLMSLATNLYNRIVFESISHNDRRDTEEKSGWLKNWSQLYSTNTYLKTNHGWRIFTKHPSIHHILRLQEGIRLNWSRADVCHLTKIKHTWQNCLCCMTARHGYLRRHLPKLDIFARTCFRIMMGIKQSRDHVTNERLYQRFNHIPIREMIREPKLKFTSDSIRMPTDEPINCLVLYESKVRPSLRTWQQRRTYRLQILSPSTQRERARRKMEIWKLR